MAATLPPEPARDRSTGRTVLAALAGLVGSLIALLMLYVFAVVLADDDPLRTTTGAEKVLSAVPGLPAAVLGLLVLPAAILAARRHPRGRQLLSVAVAGLVVALLVYGALVVIEG